MGTEKDVRHSIVKRRRDIDHDRRMYLKSIMEVYDQNVHWPSMRQLELDCENAGGHSWRFSSWGFMPGIEFHSCEYCGKHKTINHNDEEPTFEEED